MPQIGVPEKGVDIAQKYCKYPQMILGRAFFEGGAPCMYIYIYTYVYIYIYTSIYIAEPRPYSYAPTLEFGKTPHFVCPVSSSPRHTLKLQALGKLIFYRHIAHVTQKVEKLCF